LVYFSLDLLLCLVGRIAGYVTRMSGDVGGALSDGRPYPDDPWRERIGCIRHRQGKNCE